MNGKDARRPILDSESSAALRDQLVREVACIGSAQAAAAWARSALPAKNTPTYVVFDGMSQRNLSRIQLLARPPQNRATERIQNSIEQAVTRGNVEFRTLRVDKGGRVQLQPQGEPGNLC